MTSLTGKNNSTPPLRQSCDRCHRQKLRCSGRGGSDAEARACARCIRQRAPCVYSTSLAKGRPYLSRQRRTTPEPSSERVVVPVQSDLHAQTSPNILYGNDHSSEPVGGCSHLQASNASNPHHQYVDIDAFADSFPDLNVVDWLATPLTHEHNNDSSSSSNSSLHAPPPPPPPPPPPAQSLPLAESNSHGSTTGFYPSVPSISNNMHSVDVGIAQLSQLATHLHPLCRSSCALITHKAQHNAFAGPLFDDEAFRVAATWLLTPNSAPPAMHLATGATINSPGDILQATFSAMYRLLEILQCQQTDSTASEVGRGFDCGGIITNSMMTDSLGPEIGRGKNGQYRNMVVRHLLIACYTLILTTCVALLVALQQDADLLSPLLSSSSSSSSLSNFCSNDIDTGDTGETGVESYALKTVLVDMRLVMVVQLSSYLMDRLRNAVDLFLYSKLDGDLCFSASSSMATSTSRGAQNDLEMEVQQRLQRLRQTLRM